MAPSEVSFWLPPIPAAAEKDLDCYNYCKVPNQTIEQLHFFGLRTFFVRLAD